MPKATAKKKTTSTKDEKSFRQLFWERLPLLISFSALLLTVINNCNQNAKWDKLNLGSIMVKSVRLFNYREITLEDFRSINWGYIPVASSGTETLDPNKLLIQSSIAAYNTKTKEFVRSPLTISIPEMKEMLKGKLGYDPLDIQYFKHYYVIIELENIGATECIITDETVTYTDQGRERSFSLGNGSVTLNAKKTTISKFEFDVPLTAAFPSPLRLEISYLNTKNQVKTTKVLLSYDGNWQIFDYK